MSVDLQKIFFIDVFFFLGNANGNSEQLGCFMEYANVFGYLA